ncbi:DUF262 domain-containing protein [Nostoc sp. 'Peltigera membranacea cyanobiont' N6]|uniref:DUF262 domain-containing protein n=1 Tax=Nostoc sp. 'Peltigera membranacea cyanobiont' N6 TaxID=1261031 RepID=UPI000CF3592B|nr:DUF262 domain-containing protein [Nostoc sp. 'Peltigera membranacea cyanobiont' N6]AVH64166.1 hypothetical protein NPM_2501 [Nostoc sp. 'Peltigera membranacea cyanobiont' N6]
MSVSIHATEKALFKVFSNDFAFSIPAYQRPYAWTKDQAGELLNDLLSFLGDDSEAIADTNSYFLGSIVLIKGEDDPKADVVDGQQRLTTLTILLAVLRSLLSEKNASKMTKYIYQEGDKIEGTSDCYRLKLRERDEDFFRQYIQCETGLDNVLKLDASQLTDSQRNIQENASYFYGELRKLSEQERERFSHYLMTRCFLVLVSTPDIDSAYRIFSILNARGLDLSLSDFLKSEIIGGILSSEQEKYTRIWENEEENLGRETFQELFAHIRMIERKAKLSETALNEFRKYILPKRDPQKFINEIIKPYSDALEIIKTANYYTDNNAKKNINYLFKWLNKIDNIDWIPAAILYFSKNRHTPDKLKSFLIDLERLAAGLMILRADINERIRRYAKLLTAIEKDVNLYSFDSPLQLTPDEINRIIITIDGDLYPIKRIRQYVLLRLDSALSEAEGTYDYPVITVEHVLPQNPSQGSTWLKWFPNDEERLQYVHRIGNLVLLSRKKNAEAQNYDFDKKKKKYFVSNTNIVPFVLTTQVLQQSEWTSAVIEQRQKDCLESLRKIWRL